MNIKSMITLLKSSIKQMYEMDKFSLDDIQKQ